jgi:uncharacterized membrane protein
VESARAVLSTVAGATMTVAGIAFSVSILTLQLASSQYSPRVVSGLFRDPFNKRVIGIVVGTFAYCLVVLRAVRTGIEDGAEAVVPNVSVTVGLLLGIVAILAIVAFINHNAHTMDISEILAIVTREATHHLDDQRDLPEPSKKQRADVVPAGPGCVVTMQQEGWMQIVDESAVLMAVPEGSTVRLDTAVGRYVFRGSPLCTVWPVPDEADEVAERLRAAVKVGSTRTLRQDPSYGLRQLADVAIKALSPGINDPTTAQDAIFHLTSVLRELLVRPAPPRDLCHGTRRLVLPEKPGYAEWIALTFDEIRQDAAPHPTVCVYLLESMSLLLQSGAARDPDVVALLRRHARLVMEACERTDPAETDLRRVLDVYSRHFGPSARLASKEPA